MLDFHTRILSLKTQADHYWDSEPEKSLVLADEIVWLGKCHENTSTVALGMMARGDALKLLGKTDEAWAAFQEAGELYLAVGDQVGWARTQIGRLYIASMSRAHLDEALQGEIEARTIFTEQKSAQTAELLLRLELNAGRLYGLRGDYQNEMARYQAALAVAPELGTDADGWLLKIYSNIGCVLEDTGDYQGAMYYYTTAHQLALTIGQVKSIANIEIGMANLALHRGKFRQALDLVYHVEELMSGGFAIEHLSARRLMAACFVHLNRYEEAVEISQQVIRDAGDHKIHHLLALSLRHLAAALAGMGNMQAAGTVLEDAEAVYTDMHADAMITHIQLQRAQIAFHKGDYETAGILAEKAALRFEAGHALINHAQAVLLVAQIAHVQGENARAAILAKQSLRTARRYGVLELKYSAYTLLGHVQPVHERATHYYAIAARVVTRAQQHLTLSLRPGFLERHGEAVQALVRAHLKARQPACAFEALEQVKTQAWTHYMLNREALHWLTTDDSSRAMVSALERLRADHHGLYAVAHALNGAGSPTLTQAQRDDVREKLTALERQMRQTTERLYLRIDPQGSRSPHRIGGSKLTVSRVQSWLTSETTMIEYYDDGRQLWAFVIRRDAFEVVSLPINGREVATLINQLQFDMTCALMGGVTSPAARALTAVTHRRLMMLYDRLLSPVFASGEAFRRADNTSPLIIVPFGALHYLPFHLLSDGKRSLFEAYDVTILPTAAMAAPATPPYCASTPFQARVIGHDHGGRLPHALNEARQIAALLGSDVHLNDAATRTVLDGEPTSILHIAAHGEYRIDQPELSYIQFADGQLIADDVLQRKLDCNLVTLSACETGRAKVGAGDELIGLGRGFLFAGARALVASLWQVNDVLAVRWMETFYQALREGMTKSVALRTAMLTVRADDPNLHPAFWGAFQLIGSNVPLTDTNLSGI